MYCARPAKNMVRNGKPRSASGLRTITNHYRLAWNTYWHEVNRLYRVIHSGHSLIVCHNQLAVPHILLEPTVGHNVARRRPLTSWPRWPDPTTDPKKAYGLILYCEAYYFGKNFLRMAGIVQMLHAHTMPNDNYSYAHPKRIRTVQQVRNQRRQYATS